MLDFRSNLSKLKKTRKISTLPELFGFSILKKKKKKNRKKNMTIQIVFSPKEKVSFKPFRCTNKILLY